MNKRKDMQKRERTRKIYGRQENSPKTFPQKQKVQIVLTILAVLFLFVVGYFIGNPWWLWSPIPGNSRSG